ncbi:vacuolar protein sorting-associated protein 33A, partial [Lecanoromycetidae sp. Uapishka_2]
MAPHPGIESDQIREKARKDLLDLLEGVRGKKNLVLEQSLAGPIEIFVNFSTLQDHGVDKVFFLENDNVDASQKNVIFLARGEKANQPMAIAEQIKRLQKNSNIEHEFSIIWVPRRTLVCNKILEEAGVLGDVGVQEFPLHFVPLEQDVLSLCLDDSFEDLYLLTYEGLIDEMFGIKHNKADIDTSVVGAAPGSQQSGKAPAIPSQQGMKRKIKLDSTDKLYEQLRDTNGAIVDGLLNKVARRLQSDMENRHNKSVSELRDFVSKLPGYQSEQQSLKIHINLTEEIMKNTQTEIFRRSLEVQQNLYDGSDPSYQHDTIEELIARDVPLTIVLRLLCLESCISGGIRAKDLDNFKRLILHAYGYQHLLTLDALEKIGLLSSRASANVLMNPLGVGSSAPEGTKTNYNYLRKVLKLVVDEVNEQNPNDIAYVYSGYAPLSVRLVQAVIQKQYLLTIVKGASAASNGVSSAAHGWQGFEDALRNIKGETFNKVQKGEEQAVRARHMLAGTGGKPKTVVVMFLGGVTFTEIAALRFVAKAEEGKRKILICTTDVVSGNGMMEAAIEKEDFGKG